MHILIFFISSLSFLTRTRIVSWQNAALRATAWLQAKMPLQKQSVRLSILVLSGQRHPTRLHWDPMLLLLLLLLALMGRQAALVQTCRYAVSA